MRRILSLLAALALSACTSTPDLDAPKLSDRALDLEVFFDGELTAYGQFIDLFGNV